MPIYGFSGLLGSGKTLSMSVMAAVLHRLTGVPVWSNYGLNFGERIWTYQELYEKHHGIVAIDEAHVLIDSRMFSNKEVINFTQFALQSRKAGLVILFTTQAVHQVDKRFRGIVDTMFHCRARGSRLHRRTSYAKFLPVGEDVWLPVGSKSFTHQQWMYELFNSWEFVNALSHAAGGLPPERQHARIAIPDIDVSLVEGVRDVS